MKNILGLICFVVFFASFANAQHYTAQEVDQIEVKSKHLKEARTIWVALPDNYTSEKQYTVVYTLDAEDLFDLTTVVAKKLKQSRQGEDVIVVGIPHINKKAERVFDLTYNLSKVNPHGEEKLPPFFNETNTGGAAAFSKFLQEDVVTIINKSYSTNGKSIAIGHSLSAYLLTNLLIENQPFSALLIFDPSMWYNNGDTLKRISNGEITTEAYVYLSNQITPEFHAKHIAVLADTLKAKLGNHLKTQSFPTENHGSMVLPSLFNGLRWAYQQIK